jgi:hypothetical protein
MQEGESNIQLSGALKSLQMDTSKQIHLNLTAAD